MLRLLDIEFHKFKHSKSSKVLTIIYLTIIVVLMLTGIIPITINGEKYALSDLGLFNFPLVWHLSTYFASFLKVFIAIVIVSLTASEYSNRTLKQNLIDGLSKKELLLSKVYFTIVLAITATVIVFLASLILGLIYSDFDEPSIIFSQMGYLGGFFLAHLVFFTFCLFAGILVKRGAFALGLVFVYYIFESIINAVAKGLDTYYDWNIYDGYLVHILPLNAMSNLIKQPFTKIDLVKSTTSQIPIEGLEFTYDIEWLDVISVLIWSGLFVYWSFALLKRRDL
ncbi:ABC transporter permease [Nonlabens tegetincola]|uniref:ABC transporter permease n=1 Tax=Nonlabens tegetincola TaxID=323273 RepID=UPI000A203F42|nr:ABC transporter permease [Nonlabens tegetincola]ARN70754.1 ABC transporter permease [Nonlabens tegetincola]